MHFILATTLLSLASSAAAASQGFHIFARSGLDSTKRQVCTVEAITPTSCQECFGTGSVNCLSNTCYNPGLGESCCSDGTYCEAGNYCTDGGCCPNGNSLEQCGATVSLSVVPVPGTEPTSAVPAPPEASSSSVTASLDATPTAATLTSSSSATDTVIRTSVLPSESSAVASPVATFTGAASRNSVISGAQGLVYGVLMVVGNLFY